VGLAAQSLALTTGANADGAEGAADPHFRPASAAHIAGMADIAANLAAVRAEIAAACATAGRDPASVRLIAVSKAQGPEVLAPLAAAGVAVCGENRTDHLEVMRAAAPAGLDFHFIGRVQGRQLGEVVRLAGCLHSLCDPGHVERLEKAVQQYRPAGGYPVFVQANTSGEAAKAGLPGDQLGPFLDRLRRSSWVRPVGLMTMAPDLDGVATEQQVRDCFAACRLLAQRHGLERLSMGMSGDFAIAIAEGATDVRIGSRLFA
jgi:uncharacterized pyridoxal phosphate-containing UPF0001 family protein